MRGFVAFFVGLCLSQIHAVQCSSENFRLIQTSETDKKWMTENEILGLIRSKIHFMDVTDGDLEIDTPSRNMFSASKYYFINVNLKFKFTMSICL